MPLLSLRQLRAMLSACASCRRTGRRGREREARCDPLPWWLLSGRLARPADRGGSSDVLQTLNAYTMLSSKITTILKP